MLTEPQTDDPVVDLREAAVERTFRTEDDRLVQRLRFGDVIRESSIETPPSSDEDLLGAWWRGHLEGRRLKADQLASTPARTLELFSGAGGLAVGFRRACHELGIDAVAKIAVDQDAEALDVYRANHRAERVDSNSVTSLVDYQVRGSREKARFVYPPEIIAKGWDEADGQIDVVLAGPPCQGHSNLNNATRRADRRNELYLTVPAMAIAAGARVVVIENVQAVVHDRMGVVASTVTLLRDAGYHVTQGVLRAAAMGWPQRRNRFFVVARRDRPPVPIDEVAEALRQPERPIGWAIDDLADEVDVDFMSQVTELAEDNQRRLDWLFDNDQYDLALSERPDCHRDGTRYMAVYGRLYPDRAAPTITTGFMNAGQGRYIHPTRRRVITAREAARLQGFPDTYSFQVDPNTVPMRKQLGKWIGDAVPMPLGYAATLAALGPGWD